MKRDHVLKFLSEHRSILTRYGVKSIALFGSVARNEATPDSDVDLLVEFEGQLTFDQYIDLKFYLEDHLNTKVDLVSYKMLKSSIRDQVEQEAIVVA